MRYRLTFVGNSIEVEVLDPPDVEEPKPQEGAPPDEPPDRKRAPPEEKDWRRRMRLR